MILSPILQRFLALSILLGLLAAATLFLVIPLADSIAGDRERIDQSGALIARYEGLSQNLAVLEKRAADLRNIAEQQSDFLEGENVTLAAAKLQGLLQQIAAASRANLRSSQTMPFAKENEFTRVGVQLELGASVPQLRELLYRVETAKPPLLVQKLSVRVPENGADFQSSPSHPQMMVHLEVAGYTRGVAP